MRPVFTFIVALVILTFPVAAQDLVQQDKAAWSFGANPYYGGVLRYKTTMPKLKMSNLYGLELYAAKITNGKNRWEKLYNYPQVGIAASFYNYGIPDELGHVFSLTSYLDVTARNGKKNQWRFNIGTGFVYSSKRFDEDLNPENKAVSSKISYVARGTIHHEIKLSSQYYFNINLAFRHYSNGKLNMPNNGMNFPMVGVGVRYVPHPQAISYMGDTVKTMDRSVHFNLMASTAWREVLSEDYKHKAHSLSLYVSKQVTKYNTLLAGIDGFYYDKQSVIYATNVYYSKAGISEDTSINDDGRQAAITVGTELLLGKLAVILQGGFYVHKPQVYYESSWYQRYGFKYKVTPHFFPQITLKAHSRTADMVEFGLGMSF